MQILRVFMVQMMDLHVYHEYYTKNMHRVGGVIVGLTLYEICYCAPMDHGEAPPHRSSTLLNSPTNIRHGHQRVIKAYGPIPKVKTMFMSEN